jgi:hypothetical protein
MRSLGFDDHGSFSRHDLTSVGKGGTTPSTQGHDQVPQVPIQNFYTGWSTRETPVRH